MFYFNGKSKIVIFFLISTILIGCSSNDNDIIYGDGGLESGLERILISSDAYNRKNSSAGTSQKIDKNFIQKIMEKNDSEAKLKSTNTDRLGQELKRYQQYYKGLKVIGGTLIEIYDKNSNIDLIHGKIYIPKNISIKPTLKRNTALDLIDEKYINKIGFHVMQEPELIFYFTKLAYHLAFAYLDSDNGIIIKWDYYIDAHKGNIIHSHNNISNVTATVKGNLLAGEGGAYVSTDIYAHFQYFSGPYGYIDYFYLRDPGESWFVYNYQDDNVITKFNNLYQYE